MRTAFWSGSCPRWGRPVPYRDSSGNGMVLVEQRESTGEDVDHA